MSSNPFYIYANQQLQIQTTNFRPKNKYKSLDNLTCLSF